MSGTIAFPETIEEIAALYAALHTLSPSPGVRLNHAIAVAMSARHANVITP